MVPVEQVVIYCPRPAVADRYEAWAVGCDGSGDTKLFTFPAAFVGAAHEQNDHTLGVDHTTGTVYYGFLQRSADNTVKHFTIYAFTTVSAVPTLIYTHNVSGNAFAEINVLDFNMFTRRLLFFESYGANQVTATKAVKECESDGTAPTTLIDLNLLGHTETRARVSYKDRCIYSWDFTGTRATDIGGGLFKRDFSYTTIKKIANRASLSHDFAAGFELGCGPEKLGSKYAGW